MGLFGKSKKERETEYMSRLDVPSCLKEDFELIIDDIFTIMGVGTVATELFAKDCKLINLRYEYTNYTGKEKWAVVTELTEKKLRKKYPDIIKRYTPFVLLSMAQGEVINESDRNDDKYEKRAKRTLDVYGYEDDISEQFHRELITPFADPFEQAEEEQLEIEKEQLRRMEIAKVRKVLEMMKPIQKERLALIRTVILNLMISEMLLTSIRRKHSMHLDLLPVILQKWD